MILIAGRGFLGSYILKNAPRGEKVAAAVHSHTLPFDGVQSVQCDFTRRDDIERLAAMFRGEKLTVFYLAAEHNIDRVYEDPARAAKINTEGLSAFLDTFDNIDRLFFASTDCVYGENTPEIPLFYEDSPCRPVNVYGQQKLEGEKLVRAKGFVSLRLPFMAGPSLIPGRKHFYDSIIEKLAKGEMVEMIDGMTRSSMSYDEVSRIMLRLAALPAGELPPVINIAGDRAYTKYETGLEIARENGFDESLIVPITFEEGKKFFRDRRSDCSVMSNSLLKKLLNK